MVDTATGNAINRGAPGYHLETLPGGQQVLVNDRTGMVAVTDPYSGQIVYEVPKSQVPGAGAAKTTAGGVTPKAGGGQVGVTNPPAVNGPSGVNYPAGVTNTTAPGKDGLPIYQPGGGNTTTPAVPAAAVPPTAAGGTNIYPKGVAGGPGGGAPAAGGTPRPGGPDAGGGTDPNAAVGAGAGPAVTTQSGRPPVGGAGYDTWALNDMLRQNNMDGWQATGIVPVQQTKTIKNPNPLDADNPFIDQPQNEYIINAVNPGTGEIRTLTMAKVWQGANGAGTDKDPGNGSGYGYQLGDIKEQVKKDPNSLGHSGQMTIGDTLWGTNQATGVFEPVPGAPKIPKAWSDVKQVPQADGSKIWMGVDPVDQQLKEVPGMPKIPKELTAWGDPQLIDDGTGTGNKVWYGVDPADKITKPMPNMPKVVAGPKGPASSTSNGTVYIQQADGSYKPAEGIPDPNPPKGATQLILGPDGFIYRQTSRGNGQGFDPDPTFNPVAFTDTAKQTQANSASRHKAGEPGTKVINDTVYHVVYRGDSQDSYDVDTSIPATQMPGTGRPQVITTGTDSPYIAQRMPGGEIDQSTRNANYQPTDPALRVSQLSDQANAKLAELHGKIGTGGYTQDQAQDDFNKWWDSNVEPAKQQLAFDQQKKQEDLARANTQVAQNAGSAAVTAAAGQHYVGPGFGDFWGKIAQGYGTQMPDNMTGADFQNAFVSDAPDFGDIYEKATAQALAHISPHAASIAANGGGPAALQQPQDITSQLNRSLPQFQVAGAPTMPGGGGEAGAGGAAAAPPPGSNFNPNDIQWNQQANPASQPGRVVGPGGVVFNAQGQPEGTPPGMTPGLNNGAYQPLYPQAPAAGMPANPANVVGQIYTGGPIPRMRYMPYRPLPYAPQY